MLFIKKENVVIHYLENKSELRVWNSMDRDLLERLLRIEIAVDDQCFIEKVARILATISWELEKGAGLVDVIHAIGQNNFTSFEFRES